MNPIKPQKDKHTKENNAHGTLESRETERERERVSKESKLFNKRTLALAMKQRRM